jgi:hypothetical protein
MRRSRVATFLGVTTAVLLCVLWSRRDVAAQVVPRPSPALLDLTSIGQLQSAFDRDEEKPRVVLLLSPT